MEVENEVELAHIAKIFIKNFHEGVDEFEHDKFIVVFVHDRDEVEAGVALIYNLVVLVVDEIAHLGFPCNHQLIHLCLCRLTSLRNRCFSICDKFDEYHLVNRDLPCRLMRKKEWIIYLFKYANLKLQSHLKF